MRDSADSAGVAQPLGGSKGGREEGREGRREGRREGERVTSHLFLWDLFLTGFESSEGSHPPRPPRG